MLIHQEDQSTQETLQAGLRILAKIIAKEVVRERLVKAEMVESNSSSPDTLPAEVTAHA